MSMVTKISVLGLLALMSLGTAHAAAPDAGLVEKGRALFADKSLSAGNVISCAGCHPNNGHTDNKNYVGLEVVADGDPKGRSTPTLWGAGTRSVYGWAGAAPTLEGNIRGIIVNRMKGAEPTPENLAALAAYVRSLNPPRSGNVEMDGTPTEKSTAAVKRGFALFTGAGGCGACHVPGTFDKAELEDVGTDGKFKVPSLWAVSQTAPYLHDGRTKSLSEAAKSMWEANGKRLGKPSSPTDAQLADLLAYLNSL